MYRPATGFTALYSSLNWLQCTGYTALYTGFNNWLQSVPAGTGYTALYTCFNLPVTSLLVAWLHSPYCTGLHPNWLLIKKKKVVSASPDRTTARTERLFSRTMVTRPDQCLKAIGTVMFVRLANVTNVAHICL